MLKKLLDKVNCKLEANRIKRLVNRIKRAADKGDTSFSLTGYEGNKLTTLPPEIFQLTWLTYLDLSGNELTTLPPEIGQLTQLDWLSLSGNKLTTLPPEIGQLTKLTRLNLSQNQLTVLPPEMGHLIWLFELSLSGNQLTTLPPEMGLLSSLSVLYLDNKLESSFIVERYTPDMEKAILAYLKAQLSEKRKQQLLEQRKQWPGPSKLIQSVAKSGMTSLDLSKKILTKLPLEIGQLTQLTELYLEYNQLTTLPPEIGQLTQLTSLDLSHNKLTFLPPEIGQLTKLTYLRLHNNPLELPPPEIVKQGTTAILAYLQAQLPKTGKEKGKIKKQLSEPRQQKQWLSKLIIVGQGGVGKTSLFRALRGEKFNPQESTTHGIETKILEIAHPSETNVTMQLNTWDFGGQQIYHATHQFFLTNRSLFLLAWHTRLGFKASELNYWLDTLTALAPDSPVLLVATHIDERNADIPLTELRHNYPQIIGQCEISNKTGKGIQALQQTIAQAAAKLPLMGEIWPSTWLKAANTLRDRTENYITPQALQNIMITQGIDANQQPILTQWLHDLGNMLYFQDKNEFDDIVILKPQWVSENISKVLESEDVKKRGGILTREEMKRLWHDLSPTMCEHFLRLMERFDLSYRDEEREISLIVELLPHTPPDYQTKWNTLDNSKSLSMAFKLNTMPAGIPTWFIARAHRFSTNTHWRKGALFEHENHLALLQAVERDCTVQLTVRGANPHNFFALLKDGFELTLKRFPGLKIQRQIPCLEPDCPHEFNYEQLLKRHEKNKLTIECPETLEDVSVSKLLYGWDWRTQDDVLSRLDQLDKGQDQILDGQNQIFSEVKELRELAQREFTNAFHREQARIEAHCPNVFVLRERETKKLLKTITGQTLELQLYCQAPGCWHPTKEGGLYKIEEAAEWLKTIAPYLNRLIGVLKYAAPLMGAWVSEEIKTQDYKKLFQRNIESTQELAKQFSDSKTNLESEKLQGAALRALRHLLEKHDSQQDWGGLKKILTPEGHYLWLCEYHAGEYK